MSLSDKIREAVRRVAERQPGLPDPGRAKRVFPPAPPKPVADLGYSTALAGMVDTEFVKTVRYGEQQYRADTLGADPIILEFATLLVKRMRALGVPMFAHCVWREKEEQNRLYYIGKSNARYPLSPHNKGCAVDIVHGTKAWGLTPRQWLLVGHVGKELAASKGWKLDWGGDWRRKPTDEIGWDPAHWQLSNWKDVRINPR